jgi:hypothetical protein
MKNVVVGQSMMLQRKNAARDILFWLNTKVVGGESWRESFVGGQVTKESSIHEK